MAVVSIRDCGAGFCHTCGPENVWKSRVVLYQSCAFPWPVRLIGSFQSDCAQNTAYAPISSTQRDSGAKAFPALSGATLTCRWGVQFTRSLDSNTSMYWVSLMSNPPWSYQFRSVAIM